MEQDYKFLGECLVDVRWADLDTYGHVNNTRYFEYMMEGRANLLREAVTPYDALQYVLVDTSCNFKKSIMYPDTIKMKHYLKEIGRTSFTLYCEFLSQDETVTFATGTAKLVCFDPKAQKPVAMPEFLMERFKV